MATSVAAGTGEANGFCAGDDVAGCEAGAIRGEATGIIGSGGGVEVCVAAGLTNESEEDLAGSPVPAGEIEGIGGWPIDGDGAGVEAAGDDHGEAEGAGDVTAAAEVA